MLRNRFNNIRKVFNNIRNFTSKKTLYNIIRNYSPVKGLNSIRKTETTVPEKVANKATLANQAYNPVSDRQSVGGWTYLKDHSNDNVATFRKGDKVKFSHRGTDNIKDVLTDTFVLNNNLDRSKRYSDTSAFVSNVIKKLDGKGVIFSHTGHSLGGSIAKQLGSDLKHKSSGFNTGASTVFQDNPRHKNYIIRGDPVSNSLLFQDKDARVFNSNNKDKHALGNFL